MSFGFSTGDFITIIQLASKVRKEFAGAPSQFKEISEEVRSLSVVLQDVDVVITENELDDKLSIDLQNIASGCKSVLVDLEKALDKYCELGSKSIGLTRTAKRQWQKLTWEPNDIRDLRHRITSNTALLNSFIQLCTSNNVVKLVRKQDDQEHREILDWLTQFDYAAQQADFIRRRQPGTGKWLIDSSEYQAWVRTNEQTLFCPGIPGAGKTIITSIIVDDLFTQYRDDPRIGVAYLYCNFRRHSEQNATNLKTDLLKQLAQSQSPFPEALKKLYDQHKRTKTRPSDDEIMNTLQLVASLYSRVFIVVDALDECQTADGCRAKLLFGLFDLQRQHGVNILVTSRFIPEIVSRFIGCPSLEIRATKEDVRTYLEGHVEELPSFVHRDSGIRQQIISTISEAADGMFLLAQIYLGSLDGKPTRKAIKVALGEFQKQSQNLSQGGKTQLLTDAYVKAMETINGQKQGLRNLAIQVLSWITCARRPLSTLELQHALAVEIGEEELDEDNFPDIELMVTVCAGLVTVDGESDVIRLVHYTTQEYFDKTQGQWFPEAQRNITRTCITYLSFRGPDVVLAHDTMTFYSYAAQNWGYHAQEVPHHQEQILPSILDFLLGNPTLIMVAGGLSHGVKETTGTHLAAYFGLEEEMRYIITKREFDIKDCDGRTPLSYAAQHGHQGIVRMLIENGADIENMDIRGRTPLTFAAKSRSTATVQRLLDAGANIEIKSNNAKTLLLLAVKCGDTDMVRLLLEHNADIEAECFPWGRLEGYTPLLEAAELGHDTIVRLLLEHGADIENNAKDLSDRYNTPLLRAVLGRHEAVTLLLLDSGANIESKDIDGYTPLRLAVNQSDCTLIRLLIERGANIESNDQDTKTPLQAAVVLRDQAVVQLLLEKGANIESQDKNYHTPLHSATLHGDYGMAKLLLDNGANIEARNVIGETPLMSVIDYASQKIIQLLLDNGAIIENDDIVAAP
ncbi:ankyrin repeat-containing domain protein [Hypoxylon sp. FL1857]|nr:ankyrin repeat-containing domain protein [Hypoxylon sp. FL1857]